MNTGEVPDYAKVTERIGYRLAETKKIPVFKVGSVLRFSGADIDIWIWAKTAARIQDMEGCS